MHSKDYFLRQHLYNYNMKALWNWQRNSKFNRAGKQRHREHFPADTPLSVQEEGDVPTIHALMAQDRYLAQWAYITPKQLVHMTPERIVQLYQVFKDDMPGNLRELQNEVDHWKAIWEMVNVAEKPDTLEDSINQPRPILQHVHCCHSTDGDVYIDSHGRSPLQRYAASQELSALYNDK